MYSTHVMYMYVLYIYTHICKTYIGIYTVCGFYPWLPQLMVGKLA